MRWEIELGESDEQDRLEAHLSQRGISADDIWSACRRLHPATEGESDVPVRSCGHR